MDRLQQLYTDPESISSLGGLNRLFQEASKVGVSKQTVHDYLHGNPDYLLQHPRRYNFPRRRIQMRGMNDYAEADLAEWDFYSRQNDGMKYILIVINGFTKKVYAVPMKKKDAPTTVKAMKSVLEEQRATEASVKHLRTDLGRKH